jgi:hypothetical protein
MATSDDKTKNAADLLLPKHNKISLSVGTKP